MSGPGCSFSSCNKIEHLRLDRNIQGGDRLIGDDQARVERKGARQADALPLPAGKFVRVAAHLGRVQADLLHQLGYPVLCFLAVAMPWMSAVRR